jgi:hypothetical protein
MQLLLYRAVGLQDELRAVGLCSDCIPVVVVIAARRRVCRNHMHCRKVLGPRLHRLLARRWLCCGALDFVFSIGGVIRIYVRINEELSMEH